MQILWTVVLTHCTLNLWIHEHGKGFMDTVGIRNLVLNLVQQHRRHICEVLEYMYDI
jgi:hypothetical protein